MLKFLVLMHLFNKLQIAFTHTNLNNLTFLQMKLFAKSEPEKWEK